MHHDNQQSYLSQSLSETLRALRHLLVTYIPRRRKANLPTTTKYCKQLVFLPNLALTPKSYSAADYHRAEQRTKAYALSLKLMKPKHSQ